MTSPETVPHSATGLGLGYLHQSLADLGGMSGARPTKGPDSFVSTYKIFET